MDFGGLKKVLTPLHLSLDPGQRWDQAERVAARARSWLSAGDCDADADTVTALAYCLGVRDAICQPTPARSSVEACLVEQGWTPPRCRELVRSLERLPDRPRSDAEKLVADADALSCLGILGFARHLARGAHRGETLEQILVAARKSLNRRLFTVEAQAESGPLRDELRVLINGLRASLGPF